MSRASRRVGRVDMSEEDEDEGEGDGAAGAMPRLLARSSIALAPGVVGKDDGGGAGAVCSWMRMIKLFSQAESSDLRARRGRVGGVRTRPR